MSARRILLTFFLLVLGLGGCARPFSPSYFPYLLPPGPIEPTHAKPRGTGYFADFDKHAHSLVVRPKDGTSPVRSHVVLIATIYDEKGQPRRGRRVEWMLEGAGSIVEVDESGYFAGRGYKVDNKYAVSYTDYLEHQITRGNDNPNDDFVIRPGQSWCVITAPVEGDTHISVYAPGIFNWDKNKVHITYHWVDAEWTVPPPVIARAAGSEAILNTNVFRSTDHQPLAKYQIRYRVIDGPPAIFVPARSTEAVATSDLRGNAPVTLVQQSPTPGSNRVAIEVIRPPDPTAPSSAGIVIARAETRVDWQSPGLALDLQGPAALALNGEAAYTITASNTGQAAMRSLTVRQDVPDGATYVRSEPPAIVEGNQLIWTLGEIPAGQRRDLQATFRLTKLTAVTHRVTAQSEEGLRDEKTLTTTATRPGLRVSVTAPKSGAVGVPVNYVITLTNPGTGPAEGVKLRATLDAGLEEPKTSANPIDLSLDVPLAPGQSRDIPLSLVPKQAGNLTVRVAASGEGGLKDEAAHAVAVRLAKLEASITGPKVRYAGRPVTWTLEVFNAGLVPLSGTALRYQLPAEVQYTSATESGQAAGRDVAWALGTLAPGERKRVEVTANCITLTPPVACHVLATAEPDTGEGGAAAGLPLPTPSALRAEAETTLEVRGLPAFRLEMADPSEPVQVGGKSRFRVNVTNEGSLRGAGVRMTLTVPGQMKILKADGPSANKIDGQTITFEPKDGLEPLQSWLYVVEVEAAAPGDARFFAELNATTLSKPVKVEQSTIIFSPRTP